MVQRTTAAILKTLDTLAQRWMCHEAIQAGADSTVSMELAGAVALQPGPRDMMVETSPEVLAALGVDANSYPVAAFAAGMATWGAGLFIGIMRVRELKRTQPIPVPTPPKPGKPGEEEIKKAA